MKLVSFQVSTSTLIKSVLSSKDATWQKPHIRQILLTNFHYKAIVSQHYLIFTRNWNVIRVGYKFNSRDLNKESPQMSQNRR